MSRLGACRCPTTGGNKRVTGTNGEPVERLASNSESSAFVLGSLEVVGDRVTGCFTAGAAIEEISEPLMKIGA